MNATIMAALVLVAGANGIAADDRPNILWLTCEDNNVSYIGCYGNEFAKTPHIDKLAGEGFRYTRCFSNGAVCSASRSSWITGMTSSSTGLLNHRSRKNIPKSVTLYPKVLRDAGYYTVNAGKMDYNIKNYDKTTWNSGKLNWELLKSKQPFFQVINTTDSHESRAMSTRYSTHDPARVKIPPYLPDVEGIRANYTSYYEAITKMDAKIGGYLKALEAAGLAENTIVIHNSDHGGPLPRGKRYMYNSGTHCPLVIRIPEKFKHLWPADQPGATVDRLVSFVDMIPTWISLAGGKAPANYHGSIFLGPETEPEPDYHMSFRGRNDARVESARTIRTKQYLYVKNYIPYVPRGQYLPYQWKIPAQRIWEKEFQAGRTNPDQSRFFKVKAKHEFYDTKKDPHCLNNLVDQPEFKTLVKKFTTELKQKQRQMFDAAFLPESELDKIAKENNLTVFEVLRKKSLYDIASYQEAADVALANSPDNVEQLAAYLRHTDVGMRHWGAVGLMMLGEDAISAQNQLKPLLNDKSHNVRIMAAWALIKIGDKEAGLACIKDLINSDSYAMLEILNVIDWMGADGKALIPTVASMKMTNMLTVQLSEFLVNGVTADKDGAGKKSKKRKKNK